jgi:hypothetical protein
MKKASNTTTTKNGKCSRERAFYCKKERRFIRRDSMSLKEDVGDGGSDSKSPATMVHLEGEAGHGWGFC